MKKTAIIALALLAAVQVSAFGETPRVVEVHAKRFAFVPSSITLIKGQPVKLELTSDDVAHSLRIEQLKLNVRMPPGKTEQATITPQQTGDFKGRCGVYCGKGHGEMFFTVHVVSGK
jgi:cytochrome c oxidase subunit 2